MISSVYAIWKLDKLKALIHEATAVDSRIIRLTDEGLDALYDQAGSSEKYLISQDKNYYQQVLEKRDHFAKGIKELKEITNNKEINKLASEIEAFQERHNTLFASAVAAQSKPGKKLKLSDFTSAEDRVLDETDKRLRKIAKLSVLSQNHTLRLSEEVSSQVAKVITITEITAIILVIVISVFNTRSINSPIAVLRDKTKLIAEGDFGDPVRITSPPELKELADAFNFMSARLKELDQMKVDFISHLSHELRTPLTAIKEASCMLLEGTFSDAPEKQHELLSIMRGECERLIESVTRTLDLSRMEAGMMDFFFQVSDLVPMIERNISKLLPIARSKRIDIAVELEPNLPSAIIDEEKIESVIQNLLSNALKFTPEEGKVTLSARRNIQHNSIEISVSDTGPGIPEEGLKEVFEKFKRVDERKGSVRGTGLGLAIVKHIINAHGGQVWAESKAGGGSAFTFSLPLV